MAPRWPWVTALCFPGCDMTELFQCWLLGGLWVLRVEQAEASNRNRRSACVCGKTHCGPSRLSPMVLDPPAALAPGPGAPGQRRPSPEDVYSPGVTRTCLFLSLAWRLSLRHTHFLGFLEPRVQYWDRTFFSWGSSFFAWKNVWCSTQDFHKFLQDR